MEKKTIGRFIAALRKANGLTQRELAEKLNVSDKAVSRWERDESAPDLMLIPVIAEIFGVSSDELLRGERRNQDRSPALSAQKTEKQRERLLQSSLSTYRIRSIISIGLAFCALLTAMICNFGFNRAYIGFFGGCVFLLAAKVCQAVFTVQAFSSIGSDYEGADVDSCRRGIIDAAILVFSCVMLLFAACLPLIVLPGDSYRGLTAESWLLYGFAFSLAALVLCVFAALFIRGSKWYRADKKTAAINSLRLTCAAVLAVVMLATAAIEFFATYDFRMYAEPLVFDNYEDFKDYMAQPIPWDDADGTSANAPVGGTYYDQYGNPITAEEAHTHQIKNIDGEVVCEYLKYNEQAVSFSYTVSKTCLPIRVITRQAMQDANRVISVIHDCFIVLYVLELAAAFAIYLRKKSRLQIT